MVQRRRRQISRKSPLPKGSRQMVSISSGQVKDHRSQLSSTSEQVSSTDGNVSKILNLLQPDKDTSRNRSATHASRKADSPLLPTASQDNPSPEPMFSEEINLGTHSQVLGILSIADTRREIVAFANKLQNNEMPYVTWWQQHTSKLKCVGHP